MAHMERSMLDFTPGSVAYLCRQHDPLRESGDKMPTQPHRGHHGPGLAGRCALCGEPRTEPEPCLGTMADEDYVDGCSCGPCQTARDEVIAFVADEN